MEPVGLGRGRTGFKPVRSDAATTNLFLHNFVPLWQYHPRPSI
jgi:hypothetical protein